MADGVGEVVVVHILLLLFNVFSQKDIVSKQK